MSTLPSSVIALNLRSYGQPGAADRHDFIQLVLPMHGRLRLDIDGQQGSVDTHQGAIIAPGVPHAQCSEVANQAIILDLDAAALGPDATGRLLERPFTALGPAARKLIEFMAVMTRHQGAAPAIVNGWAPLLLDTLTLGEPQPAARLNALLHRIQDQPGLPWSTASMARCAGLSVSRLHVAFRAELQTSPHAWLLQQRISRACDLLALSNNSVAAIALATGFSDQSALTRAMRDAIDITPAAYRRRMRENRTNKQ